MGGRAGVESDSFKDFINFLQLQHRNSKTERKAITVYQVSKRENVAFNGGLEWHGKI